MGLTGDKRVLGLKGTRYIAFYESADKITANCPQVARKGLSLQIDKYMAGFLLDFLAKSLNNGQKSILRQFLSKGVPQVAWVVLADNGLLMVASHVVPFYSCKYNHKHLLMMVIMMRMMMMMRRMTMMMVPSP